MLHDLLKKYSIEEMTELLITVWGNVFLVIMIISLSMSMRQDRKHKDTRNITIPYTFDVLSFYIILFLYNLSGVLYTICIGIGLPGYRFFAELFMFIFYVFGGLLTIFFIRFVDKNVIEYYGGRRLRYLCKILTFCQIILFMFLVITPFSGVIYYFDDKHNYVRAEGYWAWQIYTIVCFLFIGLVIIRYYKQMNALLRQIAVIAFSFPLISFLMSVLTPDYNYSSMIIILAAMFIYLLYENYKSIYAIEYVVKMEDVQKKLMLDQIQPHFLHNSLTSIIYYIDKDPEKAKGALVNFSKYLRSNLDSVNEKSVIPFTQELEHTKMYLSLEKLRFEDKLEVEFDIIDYEFNIPVLTLQPMVENAVKHGIRKSETGRGKVSISTKQSKGYHIIQIKDDGAGFDTEELKHLDDTHIGVRNVKKRLQMECSGVLNIESKENEGTTCTIMIPK